MKTFTVREVDNGFVFEWRDEGHAEELRRRNIYSPGAGPSQLAPLTSGTQIYVNKTDLLRRISQFVGIDVQVAVKEYKSLDAEPAA